MHLVFNAASVLNSESESFLVNTVKANPVGLGF